MTQSKSSLETEFWLSALQGVDAPTPLMIDSVPSGLNRGNRCSLEYAFDIDSASLAPGYWRAMLALLLGRYSNEDQVIFGFQTDEKIWPVVVAMDWERPFSEWAKELDEWCSRAMRLPHIDFEILRDSYTSIPAGTSLISVLLVLEGDSLPEHDCPLVIRTGKKGLRLDFDSGVLAEDAVARLASHIEAMTQDLVERPDSRLLDVRLLPESEYETVVNEWNATEVEFPEDKCMHELFEDCVRSQPDALAVCHGSVSLSYRELNIRANKIAHRLLQSGVQTDTPVGISLRRGVDMVAAMMAISKAGAGYLPLDPDYPADRLRFMVDDSDVSVMITQSELLPVFADSRAEKLVVDGTEDFSDQSAENPDSGVRPDDLAYLIYTSGSTGRPKGVMVDHRGRVNNFCDFNKRYSVGPGDRLLGLSSMSFDMCAYDVFGSLAAGATLVVGESGGDLDPGAWGGLLTQHKITVWHSVPALLEMVVDEVESTPERHPRSLRLVLLGGDWIPVTLPDRVKAISAKSVQVISMGGATEVSMDSTIFEIVETDSNWKSIPYGAPMWNQRAYVLDRMMQPVPIGVPGELLLGGIGVGRGYHNRPELSAVKFIPNPFVPGERLYRTGDLCRWREDGNLQILGRIDFQVKIRGFRIELGEIEAALRSHTKVRETVVMAKDSPSGEKKLAAYVIRDNSKEDKTSRNAAAGDTVEKWAAVFDAAYQVPGVGDADPTFKITSWDSSFTGEPYAEEVVREWVQTSVDRILDFKPKRVFEIGCGTGLLLFRIAEKCESYVGIDTSQVAVDHVSTHCEKLGLKNVRVAKADAANLGGENHASYDMVIINSVAQNFPNADYFIEVIRNALRILQPGGTIFLGDMRDKCSERELQASISLHRAPDKWTGEDVLSHADRQIERQEELIVDPEIFAALREHFPDISHVEVELRRGACSDEMTKFRFNAILRTGELPELPSIQSSVQFSGNSLKEHLQNSEHDCIEITNIPNGRILAEAELLNIMQGEGRQTSKTDLMNQLQEIRNSVEVKSPHEFEIIARKHGYHCSCRYAKSRDRRYFDAILTRGDQKPEALPFQGETSKSELSDYFNVPLDESKQTSLTPELRRHLEALLPHYMVPSSFIYLDRFPLSPNGKVNRRALPEPDNVRPELEVEFVTPSGELETVLARIWLDGLGLDRVGMLDSFVAVGGSSLLATQLVSRVRDIFQVQLPMRECLSGNLRDVTKALLDGGAKSAVDVIGIAEMYLQILTMSDDEVESQLQEGG